MRSGSETNIFGGPIARDGGRGLDWLALSIAAMYLAVFKWVCIPQVVQQGMKVTCVFFVILFINIWSGHTTKYRKRGSDDA